MPDAELKSVVERAQAGDEEALRRLLNLVTPRLLRFFGTAFPQHLEEAESLTKASWLFFVLFSLPGFRWTGEEAFRSTFGEIATWIASAWQVRQGAVATSLPHNRESTPWVE